MSFHLSQMNQAELENVSSWPELLFQVISLVISEYLLSKSVLLESKIIEATVR